MKIYLYGPGLGRYEEPLEWFYMRALESLGHEVVTEREEGIDLSIVVKQHPDPESLPNPRVLIFSDITSRFEDIYLAMEKHFDLIFLVHNEPLVDNKRVFYLPVGFDSEIHKHVDMEGMPCAETVFIGTCHQGREYLRNLEQVQIFGNGWERTGLVTFPLYKDEKCEMYSGAKVALNMHNKNESLNMRFGEILNCRGAIQLCDNIEGPKQLGFVPEEHYVTYNDAKELEELIEYYLDPSNEEERKRIVEAGYQAIQSHAYKNRMKVMLEIIKKGGYI